jgi:membrane protein implicated in regulation of membrane protease activity
MLGGRFEPTPHTAGVPPRGREPLRAIADRGSLDWSKRSVVSTLGIVLLLLLVGAAGVAATACAVFVARKSRSTSRRAVTSGAEGLVGRVGEVRSSATPVGQVFVDGALWRARAWSGDDAALERGDPIVVERVDGLTLTVRRAEEWEVAP